MSASDVCDNLAALSIGDGAFDALGQDTLSAILCHFSLAELDRLRFVSKPVADACATRKAFIYSLLTMHAKVEIVNLQSSVGKDRNGRIATVAGGQKNGRFPVQLMHLTGECERLLVKPQNLNPFLPEGHEMGKEAAIGRYLSYNVEPTVMECHGRMLDYALMLMRWKHNELQGYPCGYQHDFPGFTEISRYDRRLMMLNYNILQLVREKPYQHSDLTFLEHIIRIMAVHSSDRIELEGAMSKHPLDGPGGKLIVSNTVRMMEKWETDAKEGCHRLVKQVPAGTLFCDPVRLDDDFRFNEVFLVKGMVDRIGKHIPEWKLPYLVETTILPFYGCLVHDGILMSHEETASPALKAKIVAHVDQAVRQQTVTYQGKSSGLGEWDDPPPELPESTSIDEEQAFIEQYRKMPWHRK